ncbi:hypothetical protein [Sorangium sp. So ce1000]|uniref:hypothetical protein n=1 Tax=Sorangium sp. So ce1000 TaxID=3133325 RepID=UPI003F6127C6
MIAPSRPSLRLAAVLAARPRCSAALVRSLAAALAVSATGCLVISPPEYEHPEQTAPVLSAVFPPQHIPVYIVENRDTFKDFGITVLSEDNGAPVQLAMYIDYGRRSRLGRPFRRVTTPFPISAGTIAGGQRSTTITWAPEWLELPTDGMTPERECHTLTVMASHALNACDCPADPNDMSSLTWQLIHCDPNEPTCPESCPALDCEATPCLFCNDPSLQEECASP